VFGINLFRNEIFPIPYFTSDNYCNTQIQTLGFYFDLFFHIRNFTKLMMLIGLNEISLVHMRYKLRPVSNEMLESKCFIDNLDVFCYSLCNILIERAYPLKGGGAKLRV